MLVGEIGGLLAFTILLWLEIGVVEWWLIRQGLACEPSIRDAFPGPLKSVG